MSDSGSDTIIDGGTGRDRLSYLYSSQAVKVDLGAGRGYGGDAAGDTMKGIEALGGSAFADYLIGSAGADELWGQVGDDNLEGADGADMLHGNAGNDRFIFRPGDGADVVTDFTAVAGVVDEDAIRLIGTSLTSFAQVAAAAVQQGADTVINLGAGDRITLTGVARADLEANDFLFA